MTDEELAQLRQDIADLHTKRVTDCLKSAARWIELAQRDSATEQSRLEALSHAGASLRFAAESQEWLATEETVSD